ncbi:uncharacterized protein LOC101851598 [Aplysia californica]|uniref:Uncharacterized protein LOC101851598 n=1 Tax=Aplysia californica TaxID=6500 RepID=A0ABM0K0B3_APLCA|nr:uncharacterized protein LOC101851598 [Aplysia californica]
MAGVLGAASIPFIGCVALLLAVILHILSFASPYWADDADGDFGLWRRAVCKDSTNQLTGVRGCYKYNHPWYVDDWLDATRGLESLTIIFWAIPLVILPVYIYVALGLYYRCLLGTMTVLTFLGAVCNIIGVIIFGIKVGETSEFGVGWCLIVCAVAAAFGIAAFFVFLIATCNRPKFAPERHFVSGFYVDPDRNRMYVVENVEPIKEPIVDDVVHVSHVNPALSDD